MINKRVIVPSVPNINPLTLYSNTAYNLSVDATTKLPGTLAMVTKITNLMHEGIWVINEYNEREFIANNRQFQSDMVRIDFSHSKSPIKTENNKKLDSFYIEISKAHFIQEKGIVYVRNLNVVIVLDSVMQHYEVVHPFPIPCYDSLVEGLCKQLHESVNSFGFSWWVNEPEKTSRMYYLDFFGNIILLPKTHHEGSLNLTFIAPRHSYGIDDLNSYSYRVYNMEKLGKGEIKECSFSAQNEQYTFYISDSFEVLKTAQKKKVKDTGSIMTLDEHAHVIKMHDLAHSDELKSLRKDLTQKHAEVENELKRQLKKLEDENEMLIDINKKSIELTKLFNGFQEQESNNTKMRMSEKKEKVIFWSTFVKYGATILLTLASVATAKKALKT